MINAWRHIYLCICLTILTDGLHPEGLVQARSHLYPVNTPMDALQLTPFVLTILTDGLHPEGLVQARSHLYPVNTPMDALQLTPPSGAL